MWTVQLVLGVKLRAILCDSVATATLPWVELAWVFLSWDMLSANWELTKLMLLLRASLATEPLGPPAWLHPMWLHPFRHRYGVWPTTGCKSSLPPWVSTGIPSSAAPSVWLWLSLPHPNTLVRSSWKDSVVVVRWIPSGCSPPHFFFF